MSTRPGSNPYHFHDGASQAGRRLAALDPGHFLMDERSIADLLAFAQKFAAHLSYYNANNEARGDWSAFLAGNPAEMAAFLENPAAFDAFPEKNERYSRPHLALFLTFLKLLQGVQAEINTLTRRQLDFYYQEALGFVKKAAVPDHVHVLAQLRPNQPELLIPKDTLLAAGKDEQGNPIQYRTEDDLIANRARIARLMSLHIDKEVIDIPMLRFLGEREGLAENGFLSILKLVYGTERYDERYYKDLVSKYDGVRDFITKFLKMRVGVFQRVMAEYHKWQAESYWQGTAGKEKGINDHLLAFYEIKHGPMGARNPLTTDIRDFDENFKKALGFSFRGEMDDGTNVFEQLTGVNDLYDLYGRYSREKDNPDADISLFITTHFGDEAGFAAFMQLRDQGLEALRRIHQLLREAALQRPVMTEPKFLSALAYEEGRTLGLAVDAFLEPDPGILGGIAGLGPQFATLEDHTFFVFENNLISLESIFRTAAEDYFFIRGLYQYSSGTSEVPDWKWKRADQLLEKAYTDHYAALSAEEKQARSPKPENRRWRGIYQAPDATQLAVPPLDRNEVHPRWKTFGEHPGKTTDPAALQPAKIGWALYSPALALSEGKRVLMLDLYFSKETFEARRQTLEKYLRNWTQDDALKGPYPFRLDVCTEKSWVTVPEWDEFAIFTSGPSAIRVQVSIPEDWPPLAPLADGSYRQPWPGLRLVVSTEELVYTDPVTEKEFPISVYDLFKGLSLEKAELYIEVSGLKTLMVQTQSGMVKPKKPFAPFGATPAVGDHFYITHPEIARQKLDRATIHLEWKNLPGEGLDAYYEPYRTLSSVLDGVEAIDLWIYSFLADLYLIETHRQMSLPLWDNQLFPATGAEKSITAYGIPDVYTPNRALYTPQPTAILGREVIDSGRYLGLELTPQDFLHGRYRGLLDQQATAISRESAEASARSAELSAAIIAKDIVREDTARRELNIIQTKIKELSIILPEPYTPLLQSISLDYTTKVVIDWVGGGAGPDGLAVHLEPFGEAPLPVAGRALPFLPNAEAEGSLYIGMEGLSPPQDVSFLFQMAEGSANPELEPSLLHWSYLSRNTWKTFSDRNLLREETQGLLASGLVKVHLPADATSDSLRMPAGLHWLRIQVGEKPDSHSDCIAIHTQALSATWQDNGDAGLHLARALPPESIKKTADPLPGLAGLWQPYASFHGKAAEAEAGWYTRISERLRHKGRALTMWDYERLVLEQFPDIYRVKALPGELFKEDDPPGTVRIVVIPDIRQRPSFDPFEPRVPIARIQQIQAFLQAQAPPFARVQVQNPRFLHLRVRLAVRFYDMNNFGFYAEQLDREIRQFLTPWAFDHTEEITFGGKVYPSVLVDFIENRPYVDYLEEPEFRLMRKELDGVLRVLEHQPRDADGLLDVTAPDTLIVSAGWHIIEYLPAPGEGPVRIRRGIGFDIIEYDFQIG